MGTLRKMEREVLRRRVGNKGLARAYRISKLKATYTRSSYIPQKKILTHRGKIMLKSMVVIMGIIILALLIK